MRQNFFLFLLFIREDSDNFTMIFFALFFILIIYS